MDIHIIIQIYGASRSALYQEKGRGDGGRGRETVQQAKTEREILIYQTCFMSLRPIRKCMPVLLLK